MMEARRRWPLSPHLCVTPIAGLPFAPGAEALLWQGRLRILIASTAAVAEFLLLVSQGATRSPVIPVVLVATVVYIALAATTTTLARRGVTLPQPLLAIAACADVGLVFGITIAFSAPPYYGRALIFAFLVLHLTSFYQGRRPALWGYATTLLAYPLLVRAAIGRGAPLVWREELWSVAAFALAGFVLVVEQGYLRQRLESIARLFGRAEEGDFSDAYDESADKRPDAVTQIGRAYNRVRGQLSSLVLTDPLTGCVNRRGFDQALAREVARARRAGSELALLAIDIDHFKSVNDTHGHLTGDLVLREFGALLLHAARTGDVIARTGGEEFSLVLPDTSAAGAYHVATRLCESVRGHEFRSGARVIRLTVSVGVVTQGTLVVAARDTAESLKAHADEALYAAKRGGRDRVRVWTRDS